MDEEPAPPQAQATPDVASCAPDGVAEKPSDRAISHGALIEANDRLTFAQDLRTLRSRLDRAEQALRKAEAEAARTSVLQAMLKDAEMALSQRHAAILAQAESLAAAEQGAAEAAQLAHRLAQALTAAEAANQALQREQASILGSTSWRLTSVPRRALSRLRRG